MCLFAPGSLRLLRQRMIDTSGLSIMGQMLAAIGDYHLAVSFVEIEIYLKAISSSSEGQMSLDFTALIAAMKKALVAMHRHGHFTLAGGILERNFLSESLVQRAQRLPFL